MHPDALAGQDNISISESSVCLLTPMNGRRIFYIRLWIRLLSANHILGCVALVVFLFGDCKAFTGVPGALHQQWARVICGVAFFMS